MTKEDLYSELNNRETEYGVNSQNIQELLNQFFESNVCIPKGKNKHTYADVLHDQIIQLLMRILNSSKLIRIFNANIVIKI